MRRASAALLSLLLAAPAWSQLRVAPAPARWVPVLSAAPALSLPAPGASLLPAPAVLAAPVLAPNAAAPAIVPARAAAAPARAAARAPRLAYAGIRLEKGGFEAAVAGDESASRFVPVTRGSVYEAALAWLEGYQRESGAVVVAAGLSGRRAPGTMLSRLWLGQDVVGVRAGPPGSAVEAARLARSGFVERDGLALAVVTPREGGEVVPSELTGLAAYRRGVSAADFRALREEARRVPGPIAFLSSTPQGGGVALMRHAAIRLLRLLGVEASWHVLEPDLAVFSATKRRIHNVLQAVAPEGTEMSDDDRSALEAWWARQAARLEPVFERAAVVVIDDYQPSGLIPFIQAANPAARVLYRSHIQVRADLADRPGTAQERTWGWLWRNVGRAARFISHPLAAFVPGVVPSGKVAYMGAATDHLDGLNKPLSAARRAYYLDAFDRVLAQSGQAPLDRARPYVAQVARFDPSKGIPTVLAAYARLRARLRAEGVPDERAPQLVLAGHGAVDDVEGGEVFEHTLETVRERYPEWAGDIKAAALPHSDQVLNAVLSGALFALQLSDAEGFEVKVSEALMKGVPVIGSTAGGIPLQIADGRTGLLVRPSDPGAAADAMHRLFTDAAFRARLSRAAARSRPRVTTVHNLTRWLRLARGADPD